MVVALVDVSYVMYRCFFAACSRRARMGQKVADVACAMDDPAFVEQVRAGFTREVTRVMKPCVLNGGSAVEPGDVYLVNDCARGQNWRVDDSPSYKATRVSCADPRLHELVHGELLPRVCADHPGVRLIEYPRAEADDIIAVLKGHWAETRPDAHFLIITSDADYAQLHDSRTRIVDLAGVDIFERERAKQVAALGIPEEAVDAPALLAVKVLRGDKSDNVPPVRSRLTTKLVRELLSSPAALEAFVAGPCGDAYRSNRRLVDMGMVPGELREGIIAAFGGSPAR